MLKVALIFIAQLVMIYLFIFQVASTEFLDFGLGYLAILVNSELAIKPQVQFYLILIFSVISIFYHKTKILINNIKSKSVYFTVYAIVFGIIIFQVTLLLVAFEGRHNDEICLFTFIYVSALLVLFLVFMALTSSQAHIQAAPSKKIRKSELYYSFVCFLITGFLVYSILTKELLGIWTEAHIRLFHYEFLKNSENKNNIGFSFDSTYVNTSVASQRGCADLPLLATNTLENSKVSRMNRVFITTMGKRPEMGAVYPIANIFSGIKFQMIDEYVNYISSSVIQAVALVIVISLLVS